MTASGWARSSRLGVVGERRLDDVEGGQVGLVVRGPRHPQPHEGARGEVDGGGVLLGAGEHEHGELGAAAQVGPVGLGADRQDGVAPAVRYLGPRIPSSLVDRSTRVRTAYPPGSCQLRVAA